MVFFIRFFALVELLLIPLFSRMELGIFIMRFHRRLVPLGGLVGLIHSFGTLTLQRLLLLRFKRAELRLPLLISEVLEMDVKDSGTITILNGNAKQVSVGSY